jgi:hypothetical protein
LEEATRFYERALWENPAARLAARGRGKARAELRRLPRRRALRRGAVEAGKTHPHGPVIARFPFQRTLEEFDFGFQPSIDARIVRELSTCRYITSGENVLLLGPPGVGKTHLAVALGLKAIEAGYSTLFLSAAGLMLSSTRQSVRIVSTRSSSASADPSC